MTNNISHPSRPDTETITLVVVGAHLSGMPLNGELADLGGQLLRKTKTAPVYRLFELPKTTPPKPGLLRVGETGGTAIDVELWGLSPAAFGTFVANIPAPLGIGTLFLEDGTEAKGFLCEELATRDAEDVSSFGGWRAWMQIRSNKLSSGQSPLDDLASAPQ
ncbi:allophanate hydrolase-related protein [Amaricoccus macauensis]|uniref:allophanate hydrolase-related protein n=1 Tax=Amaricoccus macauensis TaxID=57001 RepID=UPI003C7BC552